MMIGRLGFLALALGALPVSALAQDGDGQPTGAQERDAVEIANPESDAQDSTPPFEPDEFGFADSLPNRGFVKTLVRVSPDIEDRRDEIIATIESQPGWLISSEDQAEFEVVPNPEFYQDLLFSRIKRYSFDRMSHREPSPAMDIAEIMIWNNPNTGTVFNDSRGKGRFNHPNRPMRTEWGTHIPVPVDLGPADAPDMLSRLAQAMAPVARQHALLGLVTDQRLGLSLCISHEPAPEGYCPPPSIDQKWAGTVDQYVYFKPFYIRARGEASLPGTEVSFLAITPDRKVLHLATVPLQRVAVMNTNTGEQRRYSAADNYSAPATLDDFGQYQILAIASPDPLDPRIWAIRPGDELPDDVCVTKAQMRVCEAMRGDYRVGGDQLFGSGLAHFMVFTDLWTGVAPVGGGRATLEESLWQVQLFEPRAGSRTGFDGNVSAGGGRRLNFEKSHRCGGSYIGDGYILTAAHCVHGYKMGEMEVRMGTRDIALGGSNFPITSMVLHRNYPRPRGKADIALLRIKTDSRLDNLIRKGLLAKVDLAPSGSRPPPSTQLDFTGWGYTSKATAGGNALVDDDGDTQRNARYLMKVELQSRQTSECTRHSRLSVYFPNDIVCTLPVIEGEGACFTDSGGPLTLKTGRRRQLVGIVSAGIGCGIPGNPTVFTRVANFRAWIERAKAKAQTPGKHYIN